MGSVKGVRARAREEISAAITTEARRQLAEVGADGLSLRAVARELGMVSSAIYRYVASRDELLTMLIVDAYNALGGVAEDAASATAGEPAAHRWVAIAEAVRAWAVAHPHEYALVYGTPVPGYHAPQVTIGPAARISFALLHVVTETAAAGRLRTADVPLSISPLLAADLAPVSSALGDHPLTADTLARVMTAWTQLFGLVSFELFGQTHNVIHEHAELFRTTSLAMADFIGL